MAFNWDKLVKAQRDFPKPKFALDAITRHLKKRPTDSYVLAWKATVLLQVDKDGDARVALDILQTLCQRQPPITDVPFLCFIYSKLSEALRRRNPHSVTLASVGELGLKAWQNAAKALPTHPQRLDLWSELFISAMQEDCWEDVRIAIVHANKEGPKSKKTIYYTSILANQLAAEKKIEASKASGKPDPSSQIQFMIALKQMKEAFDKPTDDTIRVKDMRDLRFMAHIYCRQNRCAELEQLWTAPSPTMDELRSKYDSDIRLLLIESIRKCENWSLLESICEKTLSTVFERVEMEKSPQALVQLCTAEWIIWTSIIDAITHLYSEKEVKEKIEALQSRLMQVQPNAEVRAVAATLVNLASYSGKSVLDACKTYWSKHSAGRSCFKDLRRCVAQLPDDHKKDFYTHIKETSESLKLKGDSNSTWIRTESNVLAFEYLLTISISAETSIEVIEDFVARALKFHHLVPTSENDVRFDAALLAIVGLLTLHKKTDENSMHYLIQATIFVRHLMEEEEFRNFRALTVVSARLHLNLGLGRIAFQHYQHAKVKEMLMDTVSWVLLTRISQTHPFDVPGYNGFSTTAELDKVIDTITRMENRTDDHLYNDMQNFFYDTALDMLDLKQKFHNSITKQLCIIEKNRISTLRGGIEIDAISQDTLQGLSKVSDNRDLNIVPNFGSGNENETMSLVLEHEPASIGWLYHYYAFRESVQGSVLNPSSILTYQRAMSTLSADESRAKFGKDEFATVEVALNKLWYPARYVVFQGEAPPNESDSAPIKSMDQALDRLSSELEIFVDSFNKTNQERVPLFNEKYLMRRYGLLEALRMLQQLDKFIQQGIKSKVPAYAKLAKPKLQNVNLKVKQCYEALLQATNKDIESLNAHGAALVRDAALKGSTGEALGTILSAEDVKDYASGYLESNRVALKGVLQVKLN
ncbi:hypothetical protein DM02DRAFT_593085 [Periconia macrospinosa]|uniref:Cytoskeleton organization protein n=1 Tax=Periconia macrospinosa TaxID=97972 RepID=A0A2V1DSF4_9PLEO|nr:hypothetical protein DM02DRAFT_593085 [Periconia macrospinosa]